MLVVEDHPILAAGLRAVFMQRGFEIVGTATTVHEATCIVKATTADVAVVDIELGDGSGLAFIRDSRDEGPPCLVFSAHDEPMYVHESVRAGALGYVVKSAPPDLLLAAVEAVAQRTPYFCPRAMRAFQGDLTPESMRTLTPRETQVLSQIARGLTNKQIAEMFGISPRTVESHRERIQAKLGVQSAATLTHVAIAMGLVRGGRP